MACDRGFDVPVSDLVCEGFGVGGNVNRIKFKGFLGTRAMLYLRDTAKFRIAGCV